jgi:MFS family permease
MSSISYGELIRGNRNFRLWWGGQIVSQLGDWFSAITIQALLYSYTQSATALLWFMVATMLPNFLLGPVAGVIVDRLPRKAVMIGADLLRAGVAFGLLAFRGPETTWVAYACVAGISSLTAFFEPARISTLPKITSDEELVTANALSSVTWSILLTSGAVLGGLVGRYLGPAAAFALNGVSFLASAWLLRGLQVPPTERGPEKDRGFGELLAGYRYVGQHPEILAALTAKLGWGLAGGIQVLIPIFGARVFPLANDVNGQLSVSLLFAASGIGTALGPVIARRLTGRDLPKIRWAIAISFVLGGVFYACMAGAPGLFGVGLFLLLARMHGAVVWVFSTVLLQILTRDQYRGRVFAAETSLFTGSMMLSSLLTSRALDLHWASVAQMTLAMGVTSLGVGACWLLSLLRGKLPRPTSSPSLAGAPANVEAEPVGD